MALLELTDFYVACIIKKLIWRHISYEELLAEKMELIGECNIRFF